MRFLVSFCVIATTLGFGVEFASGYYADEDYSDVLSMVQCSPPKCDDPCRMNYDTEPCPSCECDDDLPMVACSPPKCDAPCRMNYDTKPCPSCECDNDTSMVQCSPPKCDAPCSINNEAKPCPSCECPFVQCAVPTPCNPPCDMNYSSEPCPSCECPGKKPVQCPAPESCPSGTSLFYVPSNLCPVCKSYGDMYD